MNVMTSQQRKLVYLCGILVLLIPTIYLGLPSDGVLSQLRTKYELGEGDLGDIDPSSAAMNLVLLGMRGVAVNLLNEDFEDQKNKKQWQEMQATSESIVRLQPHFEKVWEMNGWGLAYNTSAEWDAVSDRYYWVKVGGKFLMRGVQRNRKSTHLQYHVGSVYQKKIGNADEAKYYRDYFLHDPDPKFKGSVDPEFNPDILDNFLVAKKEYRKACDIEDREHRPQHIQDRSLFRASPARCQFDYAQALQKDGKFGEETREAWAEASHDWTKKYGQETLRVPVGPYDNPVPFDIRLEMTLEEINKEVSNPDDVVQVARTVEAYRKMVNYYYWRTRGNCEAERITSEAHRNLYEANQFYHNQEFIKARESAYLGLQQFEEILGRPEFAELKGEDSLLEECILAAMVWEKIYVLSSEPVPPTYPLKSTVLQYSANDALMKQVRRNFRQLFLDNR